MGETQTLANKYCTKLIDISQLGVNSNDSRKEFNKIEQIFAELRINLNTSACYLYESNYKWPAVCSITRTREFVKYI